MTETETERAHPQVEDAVTLAVTSSTSESTASTTIDTATGTSANHGSPLPPNEFVYAYSVWTGGMRFLGAAATCIPSRTYAKLRTPL